MDLLVIVSDFGSGGAQRVLSLMCNHWAKNGKRIRIVTFSNVNQDFYCLHKNIERVSIDSYQSTNGFFNKIKGNIARIYLLRKTISDANTPIILSFIGATNILVVIATTFLKCRVVISERNDPSRQSLGKVWDVLRKRLYKYADVITANSLNALTELEKYVPKSKLVFTPNTLPAISCSIQDKSKKEILCVGRLHKQKNHKKIIESYRKVVLKHPDWKLVIVGKGENRNFLEKLINEYNLKVNISLEGEVEDIENYYRQSSIFILISKYEGTANAVIEASAHGLPIIINKDAQGCLEWVENEVSGYILEDDSVPEIETKLCSLIEDSNLRAEFGRKSLEIYNNKKNNDNSLQVWEEIFGWQESNS